MEDGRYLKIGPLASQIRLLISELGLLISHFTYDLEDIFLTALHVLGAQPALGDYKTNITLTFSWARQATPTEPLDF